MGLVIYTGTGKPRSSVFQTRHLEIIKDEKKAGQLELTWLVDDGHENLLSPCFLMIIIDLGSVGTCNCTRSFAWYNWDGRPRCPDA